MIHKKQLENMEYFNYLGSMIANNTSAHVKINSRIATAEAATSNLDQNLRKKLIQCYIWSTALYIPETGTLRKVGQKYLGKI